MPIAGCWRRRRHLDDEVEPPLGRSTVLTIRQSDVTRAADEIPAGIPGRSPGRSARNQLLTLCMIGALASGCDGKTGDDEPSSFLTAPTPVNACTYELSTVLSMSGFPSGGSFDITVTAGGGCRWTAVSTVPWIRVQGTGFGTGNGTFRFDVDPNTSGSTRMGSVNVAGRSIVFSQTSMPKPVTCSVVGWACSTGRTYGALAYSPSGKSGYSWGFASRSAAEARAIQECAASDCRVAVSFQGQCAALARASNGQWTTGLGPSQSAAESEALSRCRPSQQSLASRREMHYATNDRHPVAFSASVGRCL